MPIDKDAGDYLTLHYLIWLKKLWTSDIRILSSSGVTPQQKRMMSSGKNKWRSYQNGL